MPPKQITGIVVGVWRTEARFQVGQVHPFDGTILPPYGLSHRSLDAKNLRY
jgi:hypothetical protein